MTVGLQLVKMEADPINLGWRMGFKVYRALRQAIVQLQLRPGHVLSEADVGRQLGVSRQPVREAFIKLSEVGLVEVLPQRGTIVKMISICEVENVRFLRQAIEVAIVRRAAKDATQASIQAMSAIVAEQHVPRQTENNVAFLRLDDAFHRAIAESADCQTAWRVLENLKSQMDRVRYLSLPNATPIATLLEQHERILDAITARSPRAAEGAMTQHLGEILGSLPKLAAAHPDLFVA